MPGISDISPLAGRAVRGSERASRRFPGVEVAEADEGLVMHRAANPSAHVEHRRLRDRRGEWIV